MELQNFRDLLESKVTPLPPITDPSFVSKFDDYGGCQVVVIGSSTHGTHECHEARAKITEHLITNYGFNIVAIEADWPDAESIDCHVRRRPGPLAMMEAAFDRFPRWLWRNHETEHFVEWLREHNEGLPKQKQIGFYGLDLYSLSKSMESVINTLAHTDPEMAKLARRRYGKVQPWIQHMEEGKTERIKAMIASTEAEVVSMLKDLLQKRLDERAQDKDTEEFHSSEQNARLIADAERYYKAMIKHSPDAWNLRAGHMFRTLKRILEHRGDGAKAIIWAHNSHAGDAKATTISKGDVSLGRLCREKIGDDKVALLGCGTYEGTFIAAREWGGDAEIMPLPPPPPPPPPLTAIEMELDIGPSYEALFHATRIPSWFLDLRHGKCEQKLREELLKTRKERAVGVIYDPESEPDSVWQDAILPDEFDGWVWFDSTTPLKVLEIKQPKTAAQLADTWPWGL